MFRDRNDAGQQLAKVLGRFTGENTVVLALPRGGVVVGAEVAKALHAPLGFVVVCKIVHPLHPEYAVGAMAEDIVVQYHENESGHSHDSWRKEAKVAARALLQHRRQLYYGTDFIPPDVSGKTIILVDDGIATGLTMEAAVKAVQSVHYKHPKKVFIAVPVASEASVAQLEKIVNGVIVLDNPGAFLGAVGSHYKNFNQVGDEEVRTLLREVNHDIPQKITK